MKRILIALAVLSLAACSGSSGGSTGSSGSGSSGGSAGTTGTTGSTAGTTGSTGASCSNTITAPVSFTEDCIAQGIDGSQSNDGGATLTITGQGASSNAGETAGFFVHAKDQGWATKTYTQADALEWSLLMNDGQGNIYGRGTEDSFGSFTLDVTGASQDSFGLWDLHGNLTSQFSASFPDGGSETVNFTSQF